MKKTLLALVLLVSAAAHAGLVRDMITDPVAGVVASSCNLYRGAALVVNKPVVSVAAGVSCSFPAIPLQPLESYTATYINSVGFESDPSLPFATGSAPAKIPLNLKAAP